MNYVAANPEVTTAYAWRRFISAVLAIAAALGLVLVARSSGSGGSPSESVATETYSYTCCTAHFVNTIYHPGEVLEVHWIRSLAPSGGRGTILLSARLSGPFSTSAALKSTISASPTSHQPVTVASPVTRISNLSGARPVSTLRIPTAAAPGYYNVVITVGSSPRNVVLSASSIVRIAK